MDDGIIKGTGNSRFLKSAISDDLTFEQFKSMLRAGTLPVDLLGINQSGWDVIGTALSKANLLTDATAALLGLTGNPTVNDALALLSQRAKIEIIGYTGTGTQSSQAAAELTFSFTFAPEILMLFHEYGDNAPCLAEAGDISILSGSQSKPSAILTSKLTENYPSGTVYNVVSNAFPIYSTPTTTLKWLMKKENDGKTIKWYNYRIIDDTLYYGEIANANGRRYYVVGIGRA